jgi:hypothetical protein
MIDLPRDDQRLAVMGRTGSGKTIAALWHLSLRNFDKMPWLIYDYKRDKSINGIPFAQHLDVKDIPKKPGIYLTHPIPGQDDEAVQDQMWRVWETEDIGVYIDEGYMVGARNPAFNALITQGRSKNIPMIILSQRPVWMSRFVISESDFYQIYMLTSDRDNETVQDFIPQEIEPRVLPKYHSYYYNVGEADLKVLRPVPKPEDILRVFHRRLKPVKKFL